MRGSNKVLVPPLPLCIDHNLCWVEPRFLDYTKQEERAELVGDFTIAMAAIVVV